MAMIHRFQLGGATRPSSLCITRLFAVALTCAIACFTLSACGGSANAQGSGTSQSGQSSTVQPITVEDSAGHVVGPYIQFSNAVDPTTSEGVFLRTSTASFAIQFNSQGFESGGVLYYTTSDCTGTAYISTTASGSNTTLLNYAIVLNTTAYVVQWSEGTPISVASYAILNEGNGSSGSLQCTPTSSSLVHYGAPVATTVDLSSLGFVPPFSVH